MTEDEAKTKWCPFIRTAWFHHEDDSGAFSNRDQSTPVDVNCIGSECMAWRWKRYQTIGDVEDWLANNPDMEAKDCPPEPLIDGFCGLAGKP